MSAAATPAVVVIGAGFAGLSAAAVLADAGVKVLVLEARPQLGGRATAFRDRATGELVDNGQHVLFGCYRATFEFLERIGAGANVHRQPSLELVCYDGSGARSVLRCPRVPAPLHLLAGVLRWNAIPPLERLASLRVAPALLAWRAGQKMHTGSRGGRAEETVHQWLVRHGQGPVLRQWLWEPLAVAALNQSVHRAAAAPFVRILAEMFSPDPAAAAVVLPARPLHEMYAEPARAYITARGGEVRTSALARVSVTAHGRFAIHIRGESLEASTIISAVPWHALGNLFAADAPPELASALRHAAAMASEPIVTVNLWYDRTVLPEPFAGLPGRAMQWVFEKRLVFGGSASHLSLVSSGATALTPLSAEELTAIAAREIREALPHARDARLVQSTVIRERKATFSLAPGGPPRPGPRTEVQGLFLAGDWTDTGLPATIESAVISGHAAARAVLAHRLRHGAPVPVATT